VAGELAEGPPEVGRNLVLVEVQRGDHLLARHLRPLVADDVAENLAALALPVGPQAAQVFLDVVRLSEADRLDLDDAGHDVPVERVGPLKVQQVERKLLEVARVAVEVVAEGDVRVRLQFHLPLCVLLGLDAAEGVEDQGIHACVFPFP
jgi:hypothetical protein